MTSSISDVNNSLDLRGLSDIKRQTRDDSVEGTQKVARQFEAMFLNMMLKSMRESLPHDDPLESDATRLGTSMLDGQMAQNMANKGLGLADAIVKQIERSKAAIKPLEPQNKDGIPLKAPTPSPIPLQRSFPTNNTSQKVSPGQQSFLNNHRQAAEAAAGATGVPAKFILGQAALESGWGKHEVRDMNSGSPSFNLFGIKAGANWKGPTVNAVTTEYVDGVAKKVVQKFRAYASYAEGFSDYAKVIANNPRYGQAMQSAHDVDRFALEMGRSGYATDPNYGEKLAKILNGPLRNIA